MIKVIFTASENTGIPYKEEFEFNDNITEEEIEEKYFKWVDEQMEKGRDILIWYIKEND